MESFIEEATQYLPEFESCVKSRIIDNITYRGDDAFSYIILYFVKFGINPSEFTRDNLKQLIKMDFFLVKPRFPPVKIIYCDMSITMEIGDFYEFILHNEEYGNEIFNLKNAYININNEKICLDDDIPLKKIIDYMKDSYNLNHCSNIFVYINLYRRLKTHYMIKPAI
jgi:hypothetical protein